MLNYFQKTGRLFILLIVLGLILAIFNPFERPAYAATCTAIASVNTLPADTLTIGETFQCHVTIAAGGQKKNIACGLSVNSGWPRNICPADTNFIGWSGNTARFNCTMPDDVEEADQLELVGFDFSAGCGPNTGNRLLIQSAAADEETPQPTAGQLTATPTKTPVMPTLSPTRTPTRQPTTPPGQPTYTPIPTQRPAPKTPTAIPTKTPAKTTVKQPSSSKPVVVNSQNIPKFTAVGGKKTDNAPSQQELAAAGINLDKAEECLKNYERKANRADADCINKFLLLPLAKQDDAGKLGQKASLYTAANLRMLAFRTELFNRFGFLGKAGNFLINSMPAVPALPGADITGRYVTQLTEETIDSLRGVPASVRLKKGYLFAGGETLNTALAVLPASVVSKPVAAVTKPVINAIKGIVPDAVKGAAGRVAAGAAETVAKAARITRPAVTVAERGSTKSVGILDDLLLTTRFNREVGESLKSLREQAVAKALAEGWDLNHPNTIQHFEGILRQTIEQVRQKYQVSLNPRLIDETVASNKKKIIEEVNKARLAAAPRSAPKTAPRAAQKSPSQQVRPQTLRPQAVKPYESDLALQLARRNRFDVAIPNGPAGITDVGLKRSNNEDLFHIFMGNDGSEYLILADGAGGAKLGERASELGVRTIADQMKAGNNPSTAIQIANDLIIRENKRLATFEGETKLLSTASVAKITGRRLEVANIGDSPVYIYRKGQLIPIYQDHSLPYSRGLTPEEAFVDKEKNIILKALGGGNDSPYTAIFNLEPNDIILLASDGLDYMAPTYAQFTNLIKAILGAKQTPLQKAQNLILAAKHGGGPDNITVIVREIL